VPASAAASAPAPAATVRLGVETFLADVPQRLRGKRVALITNSSAIDRTGKSVIDLVAAHEDLKLVALLAPEHGIRGTADAGETVQNETDPKTGVPIYSLYLSEDRGPTPKMLENVDVLLYDLQEVGGRTWTYVSTMALAMQAAKRKGIPFVVFDRPNPIGGEIVEGALLGCTRSPLGTGSRWASWPRCSTRSSASARTSSSRACRTGSARSGWTTRGCRG
jgi:uncharacterized protein YbbC (DUF1343 family)